MTEILYREYLQGDEIEIVSLLDQVFKGWPKFDLTKSNLDHWNWKYQDNILDRKLVAIAEADGKIIAFDHTQINLVKIKEYIHLCSLGGDAVVHPEYRGMGIHRKNSENSRQIRRDAGLIFGHSITGNPILIKMFERSETRRRFPIPLTHYVRIQDIDLHLKHNPKENSWINKIGFHTLNTVNIILKKKPSGDQPSNLIIEKVEEFDERMDTFWAQIKDYYDFIFVHDKKYMNWRYLDPRAGPFIVKQALENGEIVGFIVCRKNKINSEYSVGFIADMLVKPGRKDIADALVRDIVRLFDEDGVNIINFLGVKGYVFDDVLRKHGFLNSRRNHYIFNSVLSEVDFLEQINDSPPERLHFYFGQLDAI